MASIETARNDLAGRYRRAGESGFRGPRALRFDGAGSPYATLNQMSDSRGITSPDDRLLTTVLDARYRLDSTIGRGGMGTVYRALDTRLDRLVAIKVLRNSDGGDSDRFAAEVKMLARFAHPNLVRIFDAGEIDGYPYLVMELIEGSTLAHRLRQGPLSLAESATIGAGVAAALAQVHNEGIVHRDVKPANVLLDASGTPFLADFGIARLVDTTGITATGLLLGTPAYLAPEQIQGSGVGPPADVYALGLTLLECLTGERTFVGTASEVTAARLHRDPPIPTHVDGRLRTLLGAMTARDPDVRPTSADTARRLSDYLLPVDPANDVTQAVRVGDLGGMGIAASTLPGRSASATTVAMDAARGDTAIYPPAPSTPMPGTPQPDAPRSKASRRALLFALVGVLVVAGVVVGLVVSGRRTPRTATPPPSTPAKIVASSTTVAPTSTTTSTTSTTTTPTTTTIPLPTVTSAVGSFVNAVTTGTASGTIPSDVALQLEQDATDFAAAVANGAPDVADRYNRLVNDVNQAEASGQITDAPTVNALNGSVSSIAAAIAATVTTTTLPTGPAGAGATGTTGTPGGPGNGHGHGHGGG
jgi:serine/threonine protein kinase